LYSRYLISYCVDFDSSIFYAGIPIKYLNMGNRYNLVLSFIVATSWISSSAALAGDNNKNDISIFTGEKIERIRTSIDEDDSVPACIKHQGMTTLDAVHKHIKGVSAEEASETGVLFDFDGVISNNQGGSSVIDDIKTIPRRETSGLTGPDVFNQSLEKGMTTVIASAARNFYHTAQKLEDVGLFENAGLDKNNFEVNKKTGRIVGFSKAFLEKACTSLEEGRTVMPVPKEADAVKVKGTKESFQVRPQGECPQGKYFGFVQGKVASLRSHKGIAPKGAQLTGEAVYTNKAAAFKAVDDSERLRNRNRKPLKKFIIVEDNIERIKEFEKEIRAAYGPDVEVECFHLVPPVNSKETAAEQTASPESRNSRGRSEAVYEPPKDLADCNTIENSNITFLQKARRAIRNVFGFSLRGN